MNAGAISSSASASQWGAKASYSNPLSAGSYATAASSNGNNYLLGEGMSMNADTSNWGQMKMSASSFSSGDMAQSMQNMVSKAKNMMGGRRVQARAQASSGDYSFSVAGSSMSMRDNFQDASFGRTQPKRRLNRGFALMALPEGAEGSWGSYDRNYVIGGNWKSNGDVDFATKHITEVLNKAQFNKDKVEVVIAPTDIHLTTVKSLVNKNIKVSAQDVSQYGRGAYTGNVTADQLTDIGIKWTLTGHSERRTLFHETDKDVAVKTKIAIENGMNVMVCIGELLEERESGKTDEVNARQLQAVADELTEGQWGNVVIAYEPVWAIGTGKVATPEQAEETHSHIRAWLHENISPEVAGATRILYGGSVNGGNAADLIGQPNIDGFLVGGASLKPEFSDIIKAADEHKKK
jgi:triosephosphate isomerase (TIM)